MIDIFGWLNQMPTWNGKGKVCNWPKKTQSMAWNLHVIFFFSFELNILKSFENVLVMSHENSGMSRKSGSSVRVPKRMGVAERAEIWDQKKMGLNTFLSSSELLFSQM